MSLFLRRNDTAAVGGQQLLQVGHTAGDHLAVINIPNELAGGVFFHHHQLGMDILIFPHRFADIDGVVLFGFTGLKEDVLKPWQPSLVLLARDASGFASVCYDDEGAIVILMQRLYEQGHRHISYLGVPHADITTGKRRHEAYLAFCKKHNLPAVAALPGLGMKQGYEQVASVLTSQTTALVCATDTLALGASKYLQEQGIDDAA